MRLRYLILLSILPTVQLAQQDDAGCKDHPILNRMPNFYIDSCESIEFDAHDFYMPSEDRVSVEGRKTFLKYVARDGAPAVSVMQIVRNHVNAITKAGGEIVHAEERSGHATAHFLTAKFETWLAVRAHSAGSAYDLVFIEREPMRQDISASEMLSVLEKEGHVALYIHFDFAKATVRPESTPVIEQVTALLKGNPALTLSIEGHTDNIGSAASNLELSRRRAQAVLDRLVQSGIAGARLSAVGHGMNNPIAPNDNEDGRAKNRRVELVRK